MFQPPDEDPTGRRPQPFTRPPAQPGVMTGPNGRPGGLMARLRRRKPPMGPAGPMAPPTYDFAAPIKQPFPMPDDGRQLPAMSGPALPAMTKPEPGPMMDPPESGPMAPAVGMYRGADGMGGMDVTDDRLKGLLSGLY